MGRAYGLVLVGLQAELADALHMLQAGQHVVKMVLHAAQLKGAAVECIVQLQQPHLAVRLLRGGGGLQHPVGLDELAVARLLLRGQAAAHPGQDLLFQRVA